MRVLAAIPTTPDAEITVECNPDTVTAARLATYRAGGVNRLSFGVQSMVPHVLAALGRSHDPDAVTAAVRPGPAPGLRQPSTWTSSTAGRARSIDDWRTTLERVLALEPAPCQRLRPDGRGGHARWPTSPNAIPTTTTRPTSTSWPTTSSGEAGLALVRDLQLGPPGPRVPAQPPVLGPGRLPAAWAAPPTPTADGRRWWNVRTPERYLERIRRRPSRRRRRARRSTRGPAPRGAAAGAAHVAGACRPRPLDTDDPDLAGLVEVADGRAQLTVAGRLLANEVAVRLR